MTHASFIFPSADAAAFVIEGHTGYAEEGEDIVCAAVSSASILTANTITEILGVDAEAEVDDGFLKFSFRGSKEAVKLVRGLELHLKEIMKEHPTHLFVTTEV